MEYNVKKTKRKFRLFYYLFIAIFYLICYNIKKGEDDMKKHLKIILSIIFLLTCITGLCCCNDTEKSGHDLSVTWTWDGAVATPTVTCLETECDGDFDKEFTDNFLYKEVTELPTKDKAGKITYTASAILGGKEYHDTKVLDYEMPEDIYLIPDYIKNYLAAETSNAQFKMLVNFRNQCFYEPKTYKLSWAKPKGAKVLTLSIYDVTVGNDLTTPIFEKQLSFTEYSDYEFENGKTYLYKLTTPDGVVVKSEIVKFAKTVKLITVSGVTNFRDLGGWTTDAEKGTYIPYGLIYRSANLDGITAKGREVIQKLGIKNEIDMRGLSGATPPINPNVSGMNYYSYYVSISYDRFIYNLDKNVSKPSGSVLPGKYIQNISTHKQAFLDIFKMLSDINNYPILFNCSAGADRTGTLAFFLEGLLGVSYEDMTRDYELTTFSGSKRWRSKANSSFNDFDYESGIQEDTSNNYIAWHKLYKETMNIKQGDTLQEKIEYYLTDRVGVSQQEISNIKAIFGVSGYTYVQL